MLDPHCFHIYIAAVDHNDSLSSALALKQGIEEQIKQDDSDNIRISVSELIRVIADSDAQVDAFYKQEMALASREAMGSHALEQRMRQAVSGMTIRLYRQKLQPLTAKLVDYFTRHPVQLIVSTHQWLGLALHQAREEYGLKIPVLDFVSEPFSATPLWGNPQAKQFFVSSTKSKADLIRMGIAEKRITLIGYPLKHGKEKSQRETRDDLDLRNRFTVTLALHENLSVAEGQKLIESILAHPSEPFLIVINNVHEEMFEWLNQFYHNRLRVRNVMHDHYHHIAAADVIIAPADTSIFFTAASLGRPVIMSHHASLAEKRLVDWMEEKSLGVYRSKHRQILKAIEQYHDKSLREKVQAIGTAIAFQQRSQRLARYVLKYAHKAQRPSLG